MAFYHRFINSTRVQGALPKDCSRIKLLDLNLRWSGFVLAFSRLNNVACDSLFTVCRQNGSSKRLIGNLARQPDG